MASYMNPPPRNGMGTGFQSAHPGSTPVQGRPGQNQMGQTQPMRSMQPNSNPQSMGGKPVQAGQQINQGQGQGQYRMPLGVTQPPAGTRTLPSPGSNVPNQHGLQSQLQPPAHASSAANSTLRSVDEFVKSLDAELESLRKSGEQQRNRQQQAVGRVGPQQQVGDYRGPPSQVPTPSRNDEMTGLGLHVWDGTDGYMVVRSVLPTGACAKSGQIHEGDSILSLDGVDMRGKSLSEFQKMALGPAGSVVRVRTRSRAGVLNVITITRLGSSTPSAHSTPSNTVTIPNNYSSSSMNAIGSTPASTMAQQHELALAAVPPGALVKSSTGRVFPAKANMQWDYIATREDELTAMCGENIIVAGEYKNAGWVWAARVLAGGQPSTYRLVPANYISYNDTAPAKSSLEPADKRPSPQLSSSSGFSNGATSSSSNSLPAASAVNLRTSPLPAPLPALQPAPLPSSIPAPAPVAPALSASTPSLPSNNLPPTSAQSWEAARRTSSLPLDLSAQQVPLFPETQALNDTDKNGMPPEEENAEDADGPYGTGMQLVGDANDPYLDGMYEDESGLVSVNC